VGQWRQDDRVGRGTPGTGPGPGPGTAATGGPASGDSVYRGRFVIITGLSGAGKTVAKRALEDLGYFCVDNLPPALIPPFAHLCAQSGGRVSRVALVVDARGGEFFRDLAAALRSLDGMGVAHQVLFLEADDDTLLRRFKESRHRHPLADRVGVEEAIRTERRRLEDIRGLADFIIDTSRLSPAQCRQKVLGLFGAESETGRFTISVVSFGYKHGLPTDADLVFDVRFLPNPQYIEALRPHDGLRDEVAAYVLAAPLTRAFLRRLVGFLEFLVPHFAAEGKTQLVVAVGCTGGRHRSVAVAERLAAILRSRRHKVLVEHRDIDKPAAGGTGRYGS